jgi:hypothetical protein
MTADQSSSEPDVKALNERVSVLLNKHPVRDKVNL